MKLGIESLEERCVPSRFRTASLFLPFRPLSQAFQQSLAGGQTASGGTAVTQPTSGQGSLARASSVAPAGFSPLTVVASRPVEGGFRPSGVARFTPLQVVPDTGRFNMAGPTIRIDGSINGLFPV